MIHLTRKPARAGLEPAPNNVPDNAAFDPAWHGPFMRNLSELERSSVTCWQLYRKRPVKHGLKDPFYFDCETFQRINKPL